MSKNSSRSPMSSALAISPPTIAPAIPIRIVTMIPPGSSPGRIAFAIAPAMSPSSIQPMIPMTARPSLFDLPVGVALALDALLADLLRDLRELSFSSDARRVLDSMVLEWDPQLIAVRRNLRNRDEAELRAERPGTDCGPLGPRCVGVVVELLDGADLLAITVDELAPTPVLGGHADVPPGGVLRDRYVSQVDTVSNAYPGIQTHETSRGHGSALRSVRLDSLG